MKTLILSGILTFSGLSLALSELQTEIDTIRERTAELSAANRITQEYAVIALTALNNPNEFSLAKLDNMTNEDYVEKMEKYKIQELDNIAMKESEIADSLSDLSNFSESDYNTSITTEVENLLNKAENNESEEYLAFKNSEEGKLLTFLTGKN